MNVRPWLVRLGLAAILAQSALGCGAPSTQPTRSATPATHDERALERIGVYTGSFDPPTRGHEAIARAATSQFGLTKLHVVINTSGAKNFKASSSERAEMVRLALSDLGAHLEIEALGQAAKAAFTGALHRRQGTLVFTFVGQDSFGKITPAELENPRRRWIVLPRDEEDAGPLPRGEHVAVLSVPEAMLGFSSTKARAALARGEDTPILSPAVLSFARARALYEALPPELAPLEEELARGAFRALVAEVAARRPELEKRSIPDPPFEAVQSRSGRRELFVRDLAEALGLEGDGAAELARSCARTLAALPFLRPLRASSSSPEPKVRGTRSIPIGPRGSGPAPALPRAVLSLVAKGQIEIYAHAAPAAGALAFHAKAGFDRAFALLLTPDEDDRSVLFARGASGRLRMVLTGVRGDDALARAVASLAGEPGIEALIRVEDE